MAPLFSVILNTKLNNTQTNVGMSTHIHMHTVRQNIDFEKNRIYMGD